MREECEEVEELRAELLAGFGRWWCGGECARLWQSSRRCQLVEEEVEGKGRVNGKRLPGLGFLLSLSHAQRRTLWHTTRTQASHAAARVWHRSAMTDFKLRT
jgi:hypothetical protein